MTSDSNMDDSSLHTKKLQNWLERMRAGDMEAREEMCRSICKRMEHLVRKMVRGFPNVTRWVESDDVLQNSLLRLLRSLEKIQPDSMRSFYALAAQHIRRELLDLARHLYGPEGIGANQQLQAIKDSSDAPGAFQPVDQAESYEELDRWRRFHEEVENLPLELREVISLVFYHGWTQAQVAELFGVTDRTIRRRWQEALLQLREAMEGSLPKP